MLLRQLHKTPSADLIFTVTDFGRSSLNVEENSCTKVVSWCDVNVTDFGRVSMLNKTAVLKPSADLLLLWQTSDISSSRHGGLILTMIGTEAFHDVIVTAAWNTVSWPDVTVTDFGRSSLNAEENSYLCQLTLTMLTKQEGANVLRSRLYTGSSNSEDWFGGKCRKLSDTRSVHWVLSIVGLGTSPSC